MASGFCPRVEIPGDICRAHLRGAKKHYNESTPSGKTDKFLFETERLFMKKILACILAVALLTCVFAACGKTEDKGTPPPT